MAMLSRLEEGFHAGLEGEAVLETVPQGELVDEDGTQDKALSGEQALGRDLAVQVEEPFEHLVERLAGGRAQPMANPPDLDPRVGMRVGPGLWGDEGAPGRGARVLDVGSVELPVAKQELGVERYLRQ